MKRSRSSSGTASSAACASTRRLNARMPSSRLRNCAGRGILRFIEPALDQAVSHFTVRLHVRNDMSMKQL